VSPPAAPEQPAAADVRLAAVLHALSDPIRLEVVRRLSDGAEHSCAAFHGLGGVSVPTLSHHLKVLREAGLTNTRIEGKHRFLALRSEDVTARFPGLLASIVAAEP
jgi:DNA-binding transcriptional ArsR family regulator